MKTLTAAAAVIVLVTLVGVPASPPGAEPAQTPPQPKNTLVDLLVFGIHVAVDDGPYPSDVQTELDRFRRRAEAYATTRPSPASSGEAAGERKMVFDAWVNYERRLAAVSDDRRAPALAVAYVSELRPCYEWEGAHDCPEREARFADAYQASHPNGPFSQYLVLLAAHRWLCAAEGYDTEENPTAAAGSRRTYEQRLPKALASTSLLVRTAARELAARGRCFAER